MPSGAYNGTSREKLELSDISNGQNSEMGSGKDGQGGCFLSLPMAFLLLLLAVAIAVGVGIIVHFAGASGRKVECDCKYPVPEPEPTPDWQKQWKDCNDLAVARNICLSVPHCQGGMTTPEPEGISPEPTATSTPKIDVRLPLNVYPLQYDLELIPDIYGPDPEKFTFSGNVNITVRCDKETDVIALHSNKLEVDVYAFDDVTDSIITYKNKSMDLERQFLNIKLSGKMKVGNQYTVRMRFTGPLKDDLAGLYRSSYKRGNDTIHLATTQFQPTDARKTFPCFDEPAVKAKFRTTLVRKNHMKSLSNMPIERSEDRADDWVADHYENTVKMSTYLLAFVICDFEYKEMNTSTGVTFRVWARPEAVNQTDYALETGVDILVYFEQYFNIPFPLPKQDMIAVPDFAAGAMENWGLIIYRETALLYDPMVSSVGNKQRVAVVVSHELAHQWFGNLVTPLWWDDLWLNEGFASYVEYVGVNHSHPDWKMMEQIVTEDVQDVFKVDALGSSHPIYVPVSHPDEINEIFDRISYGKGASIIRMMQYYLGENTFKQGLTNYLNEKRYDAAFHRDLWAALTKQAVTDGKNINVSMVMDTWLLQMGFPVVTVTRKNTGVELKQKHFLIDPSQTPTDKYPSPFGYKWEVPFTYVTSENPTWDGSHHLMHKEDSSLDNLFSTSTGGWIVGNVEEQGYYRVNYDYTNWDRLIEQLKSDHTVFDVRNRAELIDDAFNLGRAELMDQLYGLRMTEYLEAEPEFLPWEATSVNLAYVGKMLGRSPSYGMYQEYLKKLVLPLYNSTGFQTSDTDPHLTRYLRSIAISYACGSGYQPCIDAAKAMYKAWMEDPEANPVPPDLKTRVYCQGIKHGGQKEWDWAYQRHKVENVASEAARLRYAMACTREPWMLSRYLEYTLMPSEIRKQDAVTTIVYISRNPVGRSMAWQFLRAKWEFIRNEYGTGFFSFTRLISGLTESFNTEFELQELKDFMAKYPDQGTATRAFSQAEETIRSNIRWMEKNEKNIADWLSEKTRGI